MNGKLIEQDIFNNVEKNQRLNVMLKDLMKNKFDYQRQLRPHMNRRGQEFLLSSILVSQPESYNQGSSEIEARIQGFLMKQIDLDGGQTFDLFKEQVANDFGHNGFESKPKILRVATQCQVKPVALLQNVLITIANVTFNQDFIVLRPSTPSSFPILLGRPWLYDAQVQVNWPKQELSFGRPPIIISWANTQCQDEILFEEENYPSTYSIDNMVVSFLALFGTDMSSHIEENCSNLKNNCPLKPEGFQGEIKDFHFDLKEAMFEAKPRHKTFPEIKPEIKLIDTLDTSQGVLILHHYTKEELDSKKDVPRFKVYHPPLQST